MSAPTVSTSSDANKTLVLLAFDTLFNKRNFALASTYWSEDYIQHSAHIGPGREGLFGLVRAAAPEMHYEPGLAMAEGPLVMLHGRFRNVGGPADWIVLDVVRVEGGRLVEHWDVIQNEATREESLSGLPMFGDRFPDRLSSGG